MFVCDVIRHLPPAEVCTNTTMATPENFDILFDESLSSKINFREYSFLRPSFDDSIFQIETIVDKVDKTSNHASSSFFIRGFGPQ